MRNNKYIYFIKTSLEPIYKGLSGVFVIWVEQKNNVLA